MGNRECGRLKGNPCGPLRPNTINVTMPFRVLFDMLTIRFLGRYLTRPMHFFGTIGSICGSLGGLILGGLVVQKLRGVHIMVEHGPLLIAGAVLAIAGLQMFCTGLIGEVLIRTYFESQNRPIYSVREVLGGGGRPRPSPAADDPVSPARGAAGASWFAAHGLRSPPSLSPRLQQLHFNSRQACPNHTEPLGGGEAQIKHTVADERSAVVNANHDRTPAAGIDYPQRRSKG